jgi:ribose transport system substrate-binding protein
MDASGALKGVSPQYLANYAGYPYPILKSAWANWKPRKKTGFVVGVIMSNTQNSAQAELLAGIKQGLKANSKIAKVIVEVNNDSLPTELQEYRSFVQEGVNLIVLQPLSQQAEIPEIKAAAKKGIPTISAENSLPTADDVTVNFNIEQGSARQAAAVAAMMGGKGSVLEVHGVPGISLDNEAFEGFAAALKVCPGITVVGSVVGDFLPTAAKSQTLEFLSTHPAPIGGVLQAATMGAAAVSAFQEAGRPLPAVSFNWAQKNDLAVWKQLRTQGLKAVATVDNTIAVGTAIADVANRMLAGDGVKVNAVIAPMKQLTSADFASFVSPSWTPSTVGNVDIDANGYWPAAFLNQLFKKPAKGGS